MNDGRAPCAASEWRAARGTTLRAGAGGLLVVRAGSAFLVRLDDSALGPALVELLGGRRSFDAVAGELGERRLVAALELLRSRGAALPRRRVRFVDLLVPNEAADASSPPTGELELLVVLGGREDARMGAYVTDGHAARVPVLLVSLSPTDVVLCGAAPETSPCVLCALRLDTRAALTALEGSAGTAPSEAAALARALAGRFAATGAALPEPGRALVFDLERCTSAWSNFARHPSCTCKRRVAPQRASPTWTDLEQARFAPVLPVDPGDAERPARVIYRSQSSPWPIDRASYGVALANGPLAKERALAEAFERLAMFHAPPALEARAARDLEEPTLDAMAIRSLLHHPAQHELAGFRFAEYSEVVALDWSWAEYAQGGGRVLVPTCLVGRPSADSLRICDATSNGYACHPVREEACANALLEVAERDALLLGWYTGVAFPRIDGLSLPPGWTAFLATQDIDVPVVLIATCTSDGSLRTGSAAAATFEGALAGAHRELEGQLFVPAAAILDIVCDVRKIELRHRPGDHLAFYAGAAGRAGLEHLARGRHRVEAAALRARWPDVSTDSRYDTVVERFAVAGLEALFVDRSLPELFGDWNVVRALVPRAVEMSFGHPYRRLGSQRLLSRARYEALSSWPHPFA